MKLPFFLTLNFFLDPQLISSRYWCTYGDFPACDPSWLPGSVQLQVKLRLSRAVLSLLEAAAKQIKFISVCLTNVLAEGIEGKAAAVELECLHRLV